MNYKDHTWSCMWVFGVWHVLTTAFLRSSMILRWCVSAMESITSSKLNSRFSNRLQSFTASTRSKSDDNTLYWSSTFPRFFSWYSCIIALLVFCKYVTVFRFLSLLDSITWFTHLRQNLTHFSCFRLLLSSSIARNFSLSFCFISFSLRSRSKLFRVVFLVVMFFSQSDCISRKVDALNSVVVASTWIAGHGFRAGSSIVSESLRDTGRSDGAVGPGWNSIFGWSF